MASTLSKSVLSKYRNHTFVETGTLWGDGVALAIECGFQKIISIEIDSKLVNHSISRFEEQINSGQVLIVQGDTVEVFEDIIKSIDNPTTFWLDAHWDGGVLGTYKCPLPAELEMIATMTRCDHTLLIDDRRLFGDINNTWGGTVTELEIMTAIAKINPDYRIYYEDGFIPNDIIVAKV